MEKKIIIGIIIIITLLMLVGYLGVRLTNKQSSINDLTTKFKEAFWLYNNQTQQNNASNLKVTREQSDCLLSNMISTYGLNDSIVRIAFVTFVGNALLKDSGTEPVKELEDYLNNNHSGDLKNMCEGSKKCGVPPAYFQCN